MSQKNKGLREKMPVVAGWIDMLRIEFGAEGINASIKNGLNGGSDFWASENSIEIGHRKPEDGRAIRADQMDFGKIDPKTCACPACKQGRLAREKGSSRTGRGRA